MALTLIHNPRCSKSRQALTLLQEKGAEFNVREYLKENLTSSEVLEIFSKLDFDYKKNIRTKEDDYKNLSLNPDELKLEDWAKLVSEFPKLLERPILVSDSKAIVGRPPESILELL